MQSISLIVPLISAVYFSHSPLIRECDESLTQHWWELFSLKLLLFIFNSQLSHVLCDSGILWESMNLTVHWKELLHTSSASCKPWGQCVTSRHHFSQLTTRSCSWWFLLRCCQDSPLSDFLVLKSFDLCIFPFNLLACREVQAWDVLLEHKIFLF